MPRNFFIGAIEEQKDFKYCLKDSKTTFLFLQYLESKYYSMTLYESVWILNHYVLGVYAGYPRGCGYTIDANILDY